MASPGTEPSGRPELSALLLSVFLGIAAILIASCGDAPELELSVETQLEALAGEDLTPAEIARQIEIAGALCGMSDEVLVAIWDQLDDAQLAFQDFVFGSHCPERSVTYGLTTGRTLTPEARVAAAEQQAEEPSGPSSTVVLPDNTTSTTATTGATETTTGRTSPSISIATNG